MVYLQLAWKSIANRRLATALTMLSIALSAMLLVGVSGIVLAGGNFYLWQLIFIGIYGVIANCFYFLGFISEMIDQHYFGGNIRLHRIRLGLFILGTVFSAFVTFFGTLTFFDPMWFDPVP